MTKFVLELTPRLMVFYLKFLEAWIVVFGPNQVWSRFRFDLEFLNSAGPTHQPPSFSVWRVRCSFAAATARAPFVADAVPTTCLMARTSKHSSAELPVGSHRGRPHMPPPSLLLLAAVMCAH
jgi:hypothetical protein